MVWRELLLISALAIPMPSVSASNACTAQEVASGSCSVSGSIQGDAAVLEGEATHPGSGGGAGGGGGASAPESPDANCRAIVEGRCLRETERGRGEAAPPITLSDIAAFRPQPGVQHMEPDGWTIVGLHTNFYAVRPVHVVPGTLLGEPASVRFTPVTYRWDYGDGARATLGTPGAPWASLGVREFGRTPTSHVYEERGSYTIRLTIDFRAEYRFAGGAWTPIAGRISLPANELRVTAGTAKTVLVERDCAADPTGPGC